MNWNGTTMKPPFSKEKNISSAFSKKPLCNNNFVW